VFDRAESYIGVLVDDLITRGVSEPYRMFTSRSEYRLSLRIDNVDERLTGKGLEIGCVGPEREAHFRRSQDEIRRTRQRLQALALTPKEAARHGLELNQDGIRRSAYQLLSYPTIGWANLLRIWPDLASVSSSVRERLETDATYAVYLDRQQADIAAYRRDESVVLEDSIDFQGLPGLSNEIKAKLDLVRPKTLGQAARIEGITPAALTLLAAHARKAPGRSVRSADPVLA
jgi:tRNA uridine 5-carboxymethylaminomethyl modification enzyme